MNIQDIDALDNASLDKLSELMWKRSRQRLRKIIWRSLLAIGGFATALSSIITIVLNINDIDISQLKAALQASERPAAVEQASQSTLQLNEQQNISLQEGESAYIRPQITTDGIYTIRADSTSIDPVISLYRANSDRLYPELVTTDDDGGDGTNSQLNARLIPGQIYELKVSDFYGDRGSVEIFMTNAE